MGGIRNPKKFREFTESLIIRREYNEVMDEFPDINRMKLNVQLDQLAQSTYDDSVSEFVAWYNEAVIGGEEESLNGIELLGKMSRMRHITGLAKIPATLGFVEEFVEDTERKLVIFVHHKDVGELLIQGLIDCNKETNPDYYELAQAIKDAGIQIMKLTAEFSDSERFTIQETFNKSTRSIMVASTLASGEGIDLQSCADCVMHERQWNPQNEDQAAPGRFRRIGQLSSVINITFTEADDTIDQHLDYIVEGKRNNFHRVMNKSEQPKWNQNDIAKELASIIVKKHQEKMKGRGPTNITTKAQFASKH
jgi:superfamily II DNA/RNA helicase